MLERNSSEDPADSGAGERISLTPWEELNGRLQRLQKDDDTLTVVLSTGTLVFDLELLERPTLQQLESEVGANVSILRTDDLDQPIRVTVER